MEVPEHKLIPCCRDCGDVLKDWVCQCCGKFCEGKKDVDFELKYFPNIGAI